MWILAGKIGLFIRYFVVHANMDDVEEVKEPEGELSDEHLDGILDEAIEEEEAEEETTDEFGNPKEEEKSWE